MKSTEKEIDTINKFVSIIIESHNRDIGIRGILGRKLNKYDNEFDSWIKNHEKQLELFGITLVATEETIDGETRYEFNYLGKTLFYIFV